ncbi:MULTISPECIES: hypothetical protein [unclassified Modestobacter]|uniref:hypothetical protein n=1 Tax=unclassified Modestobacter TaxID=2643866 RepID=UPI0022AA33EF|nr:MULTISPECIES: hypothetical protein [unclassified Modestobacter]MCZ2825423.1 hypothetical protein [Modestobacter sp. VKM Ac-2981]MCZ2853512.1 hypothetical protein [Modestobacter sp. VKM Ac-2982]
MESRGIGRDDATAQLAALDADRAALADRVVPPWWYDVTLGLLLFGFMASYAFDSLWVTFPALAVFGACLAALISAYKRITGVWVNIDARSMAVWIGIVLVVLVPAFVLADGYGHHWVMVPAGAVLGVAVALLGRHWSRAYAAELRGER